MSAPTDVEVASDVAGSLGFGAYYNEWFSGAWVPSQADQSITFKKLFPVVMPSQLWGPKWFHLFRSYKEAVVHFLIMSGRQRSKSNALCVFSVIHSLLLLSLTFLSLHSISPAFITTLLMLFPHSLAGLQAFGTHSTTSPSSNRSST